MFQPEPGISDLISKYIQFPQDPLLQEQVAAFSAAGPDQAAYVESRLTAWLLEGTPASTPARLPRPLKKVKKRWIAAAAAALLLISTLAWYQCNRQAKQELYHPLEKKSFRSQSPPVWKTGRLQFRNTPLADVLNALNSYYNIEIIVPPSARYLYRQRITADFEKRSVEDAIDTLRSILRHPVVKDRKGRYYITAR